jgi:hypothetical protein
MPTRFVLVSQNGEKIIKQYVSDGAALKELFEKMQRRK